MITQKKISKIVLLIIYLYSCSNKKEIQSTCLNFKNYNNILFNNKEYIIGKKYISLNDCFDYTVLNERLNYNIIQCNETTEIANYSDSDSLYYIKYRFKENYLIGISFNMSLNKLVESKLTLSNKMGSVKITNLIDPKIDSFNLNWNSLNVNVKVLLLKNLKYYKVDLIDTSLILLNKNGCWTYEKRDYTK